MHITLSRKRLIILLLAVLVISLGVMAFPKIQYFFFQSAAQAILPDIEGSRALQAVQSMYALDHTQSLEAYTDTVCRGMTPDGCQVFGDLFAPTFHALALAEQVQTGSSVEYLETVAVSPSNAQVWHLRVTVEQPWESFVNPLDLYAEVIPEGDDWLLVRVLFEEEGSRFPAFTPQEP